MHELVLYICQESWYGKNVEREQPLKSDWQKWRLTRGVQEGVLRSQMSLILAAEIGLAVSVHMNRKRFTTGYDSSTGQYCFSELLILE